MTETLSERRMAENEVVFRQYNESIEERLEKLKQMAEEANQSDMVPTDDHPLHFYCECSNENCRTRIQLRPSRYKEIHKNRKRFVIIPGHEVGSIERVIGTEDGYMIVEKYYNIPASATRLHKTKPDSSRG